MTEQVLTGCSVAYSDDNDDGDGPAWVANLVFDYDGETKYENIGELNTYQAACELAMRTLRQRLGEGRR